MKTYYKVVTAKLESACAHNWYDKDLRIRYNTKYILNEWVEPKNMGSKFMVFNNLQDAINFRQELGTPKQYYIFKCNIKNPANIGPFSIMTENIDYIVKLKQQKKKYTHLVDKSWIPKGTTFCSAIKLIEKIY